MPWNLPLSQSASSDMKITAIETIRLPDRPNLLLAQIHTDEGLVGLGETSRGAAAVEAQLHELTAPYLLGKDPLQIQVHNRHLMKSYLGFASSSAEIRAASVIDIALWDIFGQALNQPIAQLLGGDSRERIRAYNTCAGYNYNTRTRRAAQRHRRAMPRRAPKALTTIRLRSCIAPTSSRRACCRKAIRR